MNIDTLRLVAATACAAALTLCACGGEKQPGQKPASAPATPVDRKLVAPDGAPLTDVDTTDGVLTIQGSGAAEGSWSFRDVTAVVVEKAGGGETSSVLTLEAHDVDRGMHFMIRLTNTDEMDAGTYTIGSDAGRRADARWENAGMKYIAAAKGSSGRVELRSVGDRCSGSFELSLGSAFAGGKVQKLKGTFDQRVNR